MDNRTFKELINKGELSLILMDGGADLTPSQMRQVKGTAKALADDRLERMALELAASPGYREMMLNPLMGVLVPKIFGTLNGTTQPEMQNQEVGSPKVSAVKQNTAVDKDPNISTIGPQEAEDNAPKKSLANVVTQLYHFLVKSYDEDSKKDKEDDEYRAKLDKTKEERTNELIRLFKGKPSKRKPKVIDKKEEAIKPVEKVIPTGKTSFFPKPSTVGKVVVGTAAVTGGALTIGNLIAKKGESGVAGYNAANMGTKVNPKTGKEQIMPVKDKIDLENMTVGEVMSRQAIKWGSPNEGDKLFAVGKYQVIPTTLSDAVQKLGISKDQKFSQALQEKIFSDYLITAKRPEIARYLNSPVDDPVLLKDAVRAISREWASVADPDKGGTTSYYGSGNKANISVQEISDVLKVDRINNLKQIKPEATSGKIAPAESGVPIPVKLNTSSTNGAASVAVVNTTTNVVGGGTQINMSRNESNDNSPLLEKQYG